jgi:hypothetical protein
MNVPARFLRLRPSRSRSGLLSKFLDLYIGQISVQLRERIGLERVSGTSAVTFVLFKLMSKSLAVQS